MNRLLEWLAWALAAWIAFIFVWYLQFKFTGHPGSVDLFTTLTDWLGFHGHEKAMRIGTGTAELIAAILLFGRPLQALGALLALGIMSGAIFFHLVSPLGVDPYGDGGVLFKEASAWGPSRWSTPTTWTPPTCSDRSSTARRISGGPRSRWRASASSG